MAPPCVLIGAFFSAVLTIKFRMTSITKRKFIIHGEGFYWHSHSFGKCSAGAALEVHNLLSLLICSSFTYMEMTSWLMASQKHAQSQTLDLVTINTINNNLICI